MLKVLLDFKKVVRLKEDGECSKVDVMLYVEGCVKQRTEDGWTGGFYQCNLRNFDAETNIHETEEDALCELFNYLTTTARLVAVQLKRVRVGEPQLIESLEYDSAERGFYMCPVDPLPPVEP